MSSGQTQSIIGTGPVHIFSLANELLDCILSTLDSREDLLNFACTSRTAHSQVIPRHIEYRAICICSIMPELWAHLARRPDLARKVRVVEFSGRNPNLSGYRVPTKFETELTKYFNLPLQLHLLKETKNIHKSVVQNMMVAFRNMKELQSFIIRDGTNALPPFDEKRAVLMSILKNKRKLTRLSLNKYFYSDEKTSNSNKFPSLELECLRIDTNICRQIHLSLWTRNASRLQFLELEGGFINATSVLTLSLPSLTSFSIIGISNPTITIATCHFLQRHPSITDLSWFPNPCITSEYRTPRGFLPNLKRLQSTSLFLEVLRQSYKAATTTGTAINSDTDPATKYKIEALDGAWLSIEGLIKLECIDKSVLLKYNARLQPNFPTAMQELANCFPSIQWLGTTTSSNLKTSIPLEQWYDIYSYFPNLEAISNSLIPTLVNKEDPDGIKDVVTTLATRCPKLKILPSFTDPPGNSTSVRLRTVIKRETLDEEESISYEEVALNRSEWDVMRGIFDDY